MTESLEKNGLCKRLIEAARRDALTWGDRTAIGEAIACLTEGAVVGLEERLGNLIAQRNEKRIYVAGPMTGIEKLNFPAFDAAAEELRGEGWHVENPADHGAIDGVEWADYLRFDISKLVTCRAIYLLPGWSQSKGALLEVSVARALELEVLHAPGAEPLSHSRGSSAGYEVGFGHGVRFAEENLTDKDVVESDLKYQAMAYAPTDGAAIELLIRHDSWWAAKKCGEGEDLARWECPCIGHWVDFNGGGWSWTGLMGVPVGWRHLDATRAVRSEIDLVPEGVNPRAPVLWVSGEQLWAHSNPKGKYSGRNIPARKSPGGKFTMPLYAETSSADLAVSSKVWTVIGPDGSRFTGNSPQRAAREANRHRLHADPKKVAEFEAVMRRVEKDAEAETARMLAEHGTLSCSACGGSGHVADALAPVTIAGSPLRPRVVGVARDAEFDRGLFVCLDLKPSDDDLRALHDALRRSPSSKLEAVRPPATICSAKPPNAITASIVRDDGGERPAFCLMVAYRSLVDAESALALISDDQPKGEPKLLPRVLGVGRAEAGEGGVSLFLERVPSDDDLRELHVALRQSPGISRVAPSVLVMFMPLIARQLGEWQASDGSVLWWAWNGRVSGWAKESPWIGTPGDVDWPGYHTHWTPNDGTFRKSEVLA